MSKQKHTEEKNNTSSISYTLQQIGEMLIKQEGIHKGLYNVICEFQIGVGGVGPNPESLTPGVSVGVASIGIMKVDTAGPLTINAADLNPK